VSENPWAGGRPVPAWYDDAKLGIFFHWTAAAVPAFAPIGPSPFDLAAEHGWEQAFAESPYVEWYQNSLAIPGSSVSRHHAEVYGDQPYDTFVEQFLAGHAGWQPDAWADLCAAACARYVVLVTKHHDGVLLWPSDRPNPHRARWQSSRDIVGELADAVRARGMRFGAYYSGGLDWTFGGLPITDVRSMIAAIPQGDDYLEYADHHWRELIARYEPSLLWNDIGYPAAADLHALFADYYAAVPDGVVNNRFDFLGSMSGQVHADFLTPEYSTDAGPGGKKWEATRGIGTSFGYNRAETDADYLSTAELVHLLVDIVANGGNLLLNVGPTGDGAIVWLQAQRLLGLGWWLRTNGPAIFGTRPWERPAGVTADGLGVRFTAAAEADGSAFYAVVLGTPSDASVEITDLDVPDGATVELLGHGAPLRWSHGATGGLRVELPGRPAESPALALRITR
jgi:alpha-L-fucosidase